MRRNEVVMQEVVNVNYRTGEIYWVNLNGEGHVQNGLHPCVIVQCNMGNKYSKTVAVVPITSKRKAILPTHVHIKAGLFGLYRPSIVQCEGQQVVSKEQIGAYIGKVSQEFMAKIARGCLINTPYLQYLSDNDITDIQDFNSRKIS